MKPNSSSVLLAAGLLAVLAPSIAGAHDEGAKAGVTQAPRAILEELTKALPKTPEHLIRVLEATVQPGDASVWHTHRSPPIVYVIEGTFRLEMDGRPPVTLTAGQSMVEPLGVVMRAVNPGDKPHKLLLIQISAPDEPFLDEKPAPQQAAVRVR